jgi:hypothetical protein
MPNGQKYEDWFKEYGGRKYENWIKEYKASEMADRDTRIVKDWLGDLYSDYEGRGEDGENSGPTP